MNCRRRRLYPLAYLNELDRHLFMAPRKRRAGNRDLPQNLYARTKGGTTYFSYRDPRTRKELLWGTDRAQAIADAYDMNELVRGQLASSRVKQAMASAEKITLAQFAPQYLESLKPRELAANTRRTRKCAIGKAVDVKGHIPLPDFTVADVRQILRPYEERDQKRMAQTIRSALIDLFAEAQGEGLCKDNPAREAKNPRAKVKRSRLVLPEFKAIYHTAIDLVDAGTLEPWAPNCFLLALLTSHGPAELSMMEFPRDGYLEIVRAKTGAGVRIPVALRLDSVGMSIADVVSLCRTDVVSRYMLHRARRSKGGRLGQPIHPQTLSKAFLAAREASGLTWSTGTPPTLYECRSLAEREYAKQGIDTQILLGHKSGKMTQVYADSRGREWKTVEV